jgi:hypothetical protein
MKTCICRNAAMSILIAALLPISTANAQLGDILKQGKGSSGASGDVGSAAGALTGQSMSAGSTGNITGILEFCLKNNFLGGSDASSVKDKLMGKLGGSSAASSDKGYQDGAKGILKSGDGKQLDLSGGGMKAEIAKQACDKVLAQGKSLL